MLVGFQNEEQVKALPCGNSQSYTQYVNILPQIIKPDWFSWDCWSHLSKVFCSKEWLELQVLRHKAMKQLGKLHVINGSQMSKVFLFICELKTTQKSAKCLIQQMVDTSCAKEILMSWLVCLWLSCRQSLMCLVERMLGTLLFKEAYILWELGSKA